MPDIPAATLIGYIGTIFFLFGLFLILSGMGVIQVQQITVSKGVGTLVTGIVITLVGGVLIFSDFGRARSETIEYGVAVIPTFVFPTSQALPTPNSTISGFQPQPVQEVFNIKLNSEATVLSDVLTISVDRAFSENDISISVRSPGYQRQTFENLIVGDKVVFHGQLDYEILIADFTAKINVFVSDYDVQMVVRAISSLEKKPTPVPVVKEIVVIEIGEEVDVFNGEITIAFVSDSFLNHQIKVSSSGYVSETYFISTGRKMRYDGEYTYLIVVTDFNTAGRVELTVSK